MATTVRAHDESFRARDGCVVERDALAGLMREFVSTWQRKNPSADPTRPASGEMGALAWLEERIGAMPGLTSATVTREMLNNILRGDSPSRRARREVELRHADPILTAMGCEDALRDGRLRVRPNPRAAKQRRFECCRGSGFTDALSGLPPAAPAERELARQYRAGWQEAALLGTVSPAR